MTITDWPGHLVETEEDREAVLAKHGAEHIMECERCHKDFFSLKLKEPKCYGCWYATFLDDAEARYQDVFDVLRGAGFSPEMIQTGGMCLAITIPHGDAHHFLLTDQEDVLSLEREVSQGWGLGAYENEQGDPLFVFDGGSNDLGTSDVKNADTALALVRTGNAALRDRLAKDEDGQ
jgi:hypothetical protein